MISTRELIKRVEEAASTVRSARVIAEQIQVRPTPDQVDVLLSSLKRACRMLEFAKYDEKFSTHEETDYPSRIAAMEAIEKMRPDERVGFQLNTLEDGGCKVRVWLNGIAA